MVDPNAGKFIASLVKSLQMVCHGYMDFNDNIEIIGHINLRIDNRQKFDYIVNEQVCKQGGESTFFQSNSYHSLPPSKHNGAERERQHSGKFEDEASVNNHHRLDDPVAALSGSRVQVDLSGPVPVTRSTSAPSHDGFFSTAGSNRRRSHSRDSRLHAVDEEHAASLQTQDHNFNHSSSLVAKDREEMERDEVELAGNGGDRTEPLAMYKDSDLARQRQDVIVKPEPSELLDSSMDESGGITRDSEVLDASSSAGMMPSAHQSVLAAAAHSGHTMLATTTLGHPAYFDTSLAQQDASQASRQALVQQALMQQFLNAQKQAQQIALPDVEQKPLALVVAKGPVQKFLHPRLKHVQETKGLNQHTSSQSSPSQKTEKEKDGTDKVKVTEDAAQAPSTSSSDPTPPQVKVEDRLVQKTSRRGRGRGSKRGEQTALTRRNRRQIHCSYCDYTSVRRYNTERHIRLRHPNYRYKCPLQHCGQILLDEPELRLHLQGHSGAAFLLSCHHCGALCGDYDTLLNHQNSCVGLPTSHTAAAASAADGVDPPRLLREQKGEEGDAPSGNMLVNEGHAGTDDNEDIVVRLKADAGDDVAGGHCSSHGDGHDDDDDDGDGCVEIVDDYNLPVHFMVKEEANVSPVSSS